MTHPLDVSELEPLQIVTSPPPAHALAPPLMSIAPPPPKHSAAADAAEMDTDPPPPDDVDAPAHIEKAPPVPLVLLPTMRLRLPPWDASAAPLLKDTSPLGPEHDEPAEKGDEGVEGGHELPRAARRVKMRADRVQRAAAD